MRRDIGIAAAALTLSALVPAASDATIRYGDIQISGNLESQQLFRVDEDNNEPFQAFDIVQQRNTFRLQYEHEMVKAGQFLGMLQVPGVKGANFFAYYRFVYDSVYDIEPGPRFNNQDGSDGGAFDTYSNAERHALAFENTLREVFVDLELQKLFGKLPISLRIGRQQIVWGNTVNFRAIDTVNALDLNWHFQQEAGILGKVGFSELRVPAWAVKMLVKLPTVGVFANSYLEAFDIPFEFQPTRIRGQPRPWGLPDRLPFRPGVVTAVGNQFAQVCFDTTGSRAPTDDDGIPLTPSNVVDFSNAARTGLCPYKGLQQSTLRQGIYDAHDPMDVNQFGARLGSTFSPLALGFTVNYKYQRHIVDATGGTLAKSHQNLVEAQPLDFLDVSPGMQHSTTDPLRRNMTFDTIGYVRVPIEFYYPYVHVFGLGLDYFDEFTSAVYNLEVGASKGVPIANANPDPDFVGMRRTWEMEIALLIDRPTWIRFLNPRSTFTTLIQGNLSMVPDRDQATFGPNPFDTVPPQGNRLLSGDVGSPSTATAFIFRDEAHGEIPSAIPGGAPTPIATVDFRRRFEYLTVVALQTFYWGGSLSPLFAWVSDWTNAPSMQWQFFVQYLPTPNLILEPGFRIFWTNGRTVDDRYSIGRMSGRSEAQLKMTYQF